MKITIKRPSVRKAGGRREAKVTTRLRRVLPDSVLGVSLRLQRKGHTVARKGFAVKQPRNASRTFTWRVPKGLKPGTYRLVADVMVASTGAKPSVKRASRRTAVRIRR